MNRLNLELTSITTDAVTATDVDSKRSIVLRLDMFISFAHTAAECELLREAMTFRDQLLAEIKQEGMQL